MSPPTTRVDNVLPWYFERGQGMNRIVACVQSHPQPAMYQVLISWWNLIPKIITWVIIATIPHISIIISIYQKKYINHNQAFPPKRTWFLLKVNYGKALRDLKILYYNHTKIPLGDLKLIACVMDQHYPRYHVRDLKDSSVRSF